MWAILGHCFRPNVTHNLNLHNRNWVCLRDRRRSATVARVCVITSTYSFMFSTQNKKKNTSFQVQMILWQCCTVEADRSTSPPSAWDELTGIVCLFCSSDRRAHHRNLQAQAVSFPLGSFWWQGLRAHRGRNQVPCWGNDAPGRFWQISGLACSNKEGKGQIRVLNLTCIVGC